MIKKFIDKYVRNMINYETALIYKKIDSEYNDLSQKIKNEKLLFGKDFRNMIDDFKKEIEQKDQRIISLVEQTKNQIIERMVSTTPRKEIKEKLKLPTKKEKILALLERSGRNYSINSIHLIMNDVTKSQKSHTHQCLAQLKKEGKIINPKRSIYKIKGE